MNAADKKGKHILIADGETTVQDLLAKELAAQGFQVSLAKDGLDAIERIQKESINLLICDVNLEKVAGMEVLEEVKKYNADLEVIVTTHESTVEMAVSAMKKGAYDFVHKPYPIEEMLVLVEKALEKSDLKALIGLYESSKAIFSTVKLDELLRTVMDLLLRVLRADEGSLMLLDSNNDLYIAASRGLTDEVIKNTKIKIGERVSGRVAKERKEMLLISGLDRYSEFKGTGSNPRIQSSIILPMVCRDELVGVLNLNRVSYRKNFTTSDLHNASIFVSQVAQAVQNAKLYHSLEEKVAELHKAYRTLDDTKNLLVESEKLASIGRLVAGVAHEINNPLTAVIGYTDMLMNAPGVDEETRDQLNVIFREAQRCRDIVHDLLIFARKRKPNWKWLNVQELLDETLEVTELEMKKSGVTVECDCPKDTPPLPADPSQLKQVFLNLLKNSRQALVDVAPEKRRIHIRVVSAGGKLKFVFADDGPGISQENLTKIFDPFFTTKEIGAGTGLGLSLSYGIIKEHGGTITAESRPGEGAEFTIELLLTPPGSIEPGKVLRRRSTDGPYTGKGIRTLLIEDERPIQAFLKKGLHAQGFDVDSAFDGEDALAKIKEGGYEVIICDYMLPRMSGVELFKKAVQWDPGISSRFIFITGSVVDKELSDFFEKYNLPFLVKHFSNEELFGLINKKLLKPPDA